MTKKVQYVIDDKIYDVRLEGSPDFSYGKQEILSTSKTDVTYHQDWYDNGFKAFNFLNKDEFAALNSGLKNSISKILSSHVPNLEGFELSKYHKFVPTDDIHYKVVSVTRDLFPADFNFPLTDIISRFERILGFELTDTNPDNGEQLHIIIRINRPKSSDFNPPHKDIYEDWDQSSELPRFVNFWIPICGVNSKSSLPVAPGSHRLAENKILRTFEGGVVEGKQYRVRSILEWDGSNKMIRPVINYGEVLIFSSHLIHGLAFNDQEDQTRIALEFRLFKKR